MTAFTARYQLFYLCHCFNKLNKSWSFHNIKRIWLLAHIDQKGVTFLNCNFHSIYLLSFSWFTFIYYICFLSIYNTFCFHEYFCILIWKGMLVTLFWFNKWNCLHLFGIRAIMSYEWNNLNTIISYTVHIHISAKW